MTEFTTLTATPAKLMSSLKKKILALESITQDSTITQIADINQVSRKFIYAQKLKALNAINDVFVEDKNQDEILFHLPVTKRWLEQFVLSLVFDCRSCFRGVIKAMDNLLDYNLSLGSIFTIVQSAIPAAKIINDTQDLSAIKMAAQDEIFQQNKPVLTGVDIPSLYCYLLAREKNRDADTWAIHLLDLKKQQFEPERVIADDGSGLRAGHALVFPTIPCDADHFHIIKTLMELRRFFRNKLKTAISYLCSIECKIEKAILLERPHPHAATLLNALAHEREIRYVSNSIDTLVSWMEHDVLMMAGPALFVRLELFDFIVSEFKKLEKIHPHRIRAVRVTLKNQRNRLLAFICVLNTKFKVIASTYSLPLNIIWQMCELQRCTQGESNYAIRSVPLQLTLSDDQYDQVEDAVLVAMSTTERTSSMVENLNSRLSPYFFLRREIGHRYLELLKFYLNHTPFLRSQHESRRKKSPTEILTKTPHPHWLEMLGYNRFKRAA